MPETSVQTESLCPLCLQRTKALRTTEADRVYLEKTCPTHGKLNRVLLWKNYPYSYTKWQRTCGEDTNDTLDSSVNCPFDCGICPGHRQDTCTAILEVTHRCNLRCPVCFADTETAQITEPSKQQIARMLETVLDRSGTCPVQFSGGEPTLRDDLPEIASLARSMGFEHIQVNTNGLRLSREPGFCEALKKAGVSTIFLQFDGLTDEVHMHFRGAALSEIKCKAVEYCSQYKLGVILVPTLARGINDNQIGAIIQFAKERIPAVRGVHFQPMAYLGRYQETPDNDQRLLIPEILASIESQTRGEVKAEHFIPPGCEESHCSFSAYAILGDDGKLVPTTRFEITQQIPSCCSKDAARKSREYVRSQWKFREPELPMIESRPSSDTGCGCGIQGEGFLERARSHSLCISGMAFQDAWNIDLQRLQRCCVHVVTRESSMIPFCAYYMTDSKGQRLYQPPDKSI